jgi:hypothetical protein
MLEISLASSEAFFLLALSPQRKAASSVHILEISLASDSEASFFCLLIFFEGNLQVQDKSLEKFLLLLLKLFFCLALFVLKGSCSSLVQMLFEISLASSEAFLFACCNSLKGNLLQV